MGPARVHRVFRDPSTSARSPNERRDAAELISIQPLSYDQWLAAWSGNILFAALGAILLLRAEGR